MNIDDKMRQREATMKENFQDFMDQPQTRFMMSIIPTGENKDALGVLIQAAFEAGFGSGGANVAADFLRAMMTKK